VSSDYDASHEGKGDVYYTAARSLPQEIEETTGQVGALHFAIFVMLTSSPHTWKAEVFATTGALTTTDFLAEALEREQARTGAATETMAADIV